MSRTKSRKKGIAPSQAVLPDFVIHPDAIARNAHYVRRSGHPYPPVPTCKCALCTVARRVRGGKEP